AGGALRPVQFVVIQAGSLPRSTCPIVRETVCWVTPSVPPVFRFASVVVELAGAAICATVVLPGDGVVLWMFATADSVLPWSVFVPLQGRLSFSAVAGDGGQTLVPPAAIALADEPESVVGLVKGMQLLPAEHVPDVYEPPAAERLVV